MNKIKVIIFDWAGTTVDYGCFAPVRAFMEVFKEYGIEPTMEEVREPMGMLKIDHIRTMLNMPRIKKCCGKIRTGTDRGRCGKAIWHFRGKTVKHPASVCGPETGSCKSC